MSGTADTATQRLGKRWVLWSVVAFGLLSLVQAPGKRAADTKYDLTENPLGFLARALHLWSNQAPLGQVQNQAYGYFFPQGSFFALGHLVGIPPWLIQRAWWALLLLAGFWGMVRLCETAGVGSRGSRVVAGLAYALSPRILTTLGAISSETLPVILAPWVMLAPVALGVGCASRRGGMRSPAGSAVAVALLGAVNAVATVAATLPAIVWWGCYRPNRAWWRFTRAWIPLLLAAVAWWIVPLLILGRFSPPFLDFIESAAVTTRWTSLTEVLRGTDSWTPFISPERIAGATLVSQPAAVLATGLLAAAGLAGLVLPRPLPGRGRWVALLGLGLVGICAGYVGSLDGLFAHGVRAFLDAGGAPLRNVHKLEPLIRIPLVIGLAHALARMPLPGTVSWRRALRAFAHVERDRRVALTVVILTALALGTASAWTGHLAPRGTYSRTPAYWQQTADWLSEHASDTRALVVPGAPFAIHTWGMTRDEPLQALARSPWAVRDAVPLTPPGAIRALDSVQRLIAAGQPSEGLATALRSQGIGYVVLRNDLDPDTSRSTRPLLAHNTIENSPGLVKVAEFGDRAPPADTDKTVADADLRPDYRPVQIFRVTVPEPGLAAHVHSGPGAPAEFPGAYTIPVDDIATVQGGPEVLERLARTPDTRTATTVTTSDAAAARIRLGPVTVTDTPTARETDFGGVDQHSSALRSPEDPRRTANRVPDYPVPGQNPVIGQWSGARLTTSSSASDATAIGGSSPGNSLAALVDGDPETAWLSNPGESGLGQWVRLDLEKPIGAGLLHLTASPPTFGDPVTSVEVRTNNGTVSSRLGKPGQPLAISLPAGQTTWVSITATHTEHGTETGQFGLSEVTLDDYTDGNPRRIALAHHTLVPPPPTGAVVRGWDLGQEFPGRSACFPAPDRVRCSQGLARPPEETADFTRVLTVPQQTSVIAQLTLRPRQGKALDDLVARADRPRATADADTEELSGAAAALVDGDPGTSWTAPPDTARNPEAGKPTVTLQLPHPSLVTGLQLTTSAGKLPAAPRSVAVDLGDGPQVRDLDKDHRVSRIELHPRLTDRIEITMQSWRALSDPGVLGGQPQPTGLAEIAPLGPDLPLPTATGNRPAPNDPITIGCNTGPVLDIAGQRIPVSLSVTPEQLRNNASLAARPCSPTPLQLPKGNTEVRVEPGPLFFVERLQLTNAIPPPTPPPHSRTLLVLPMSENAGWSATADGKRLSPVTVNGWQQGWVVPAGAGPVTVSFPIDRWYRWGLWGGWALLLIPLILAMRRRRGDVFDPAPRPWETRWLPAGCWIAGCAVVAGIAGAAVATVGLLGLRMCPRSRLVDIRRWAPVVVAGSATVAAVVLAMGPWRPGTHYLGDSLWVQIPALLAVNIVGLLSLPGQAADPSAGPTGEQAVPPRHDSPPPPAP